MLIDVRRSVFALKIIVRHLRDKWDKSQEEFSRVLGLSQATVVKLERAKYEKLPNHETLIPLAHALNISYWQLIKQLEEFDGIEENLLLEDKSVEKSRILTDISNLNNFDDCLDLLLACAVRCQELRHKKDL